MLDALARFCGRRTHGDDTTEVASFYTAGDSVLIAGHRYADHRYACGHGGHGGAVPGMRDDEVRVRQHGCVRNELLGGDVGGQPQLMRGDGRSKRDQHTRVEAGNRVGNAL